MTRMEKYDIKTIKTAVDPSPFVLIAEDDPDDRLIIEEAMEDSSFSLDYRFVGDGEELMEFLMSARPLPSLILLDLNLPKKDGREALREIKAHPKLRTIPIVVLTTSINKEDIAYCYDSGANSYIAKPTEYGVMRDTIQTLKKYWFDVTRLP